MGRRKLVLELIPNEKARRITYEKRKKGMMKKAQEFTTLCGVDTCMIIYGPAGSAATTEPEIWPASPEKVKCIIERYMSKGADRRAKRMVGLPEFFADRNRKVNAELAKVRLASWEAKYPISEALIDGLSEEDMRRLLGSLGHKLEAAKARLAVMKEDAMRRSSSLMNDHNVPANDHTYHHHHHMPCSCQNHFPPGQDFHFAIPEGTMLSETSLYGPIIGNVSSEGTPSFGACYDALMVQPAPPHAALGDAGRSNPAPDDAGFFAGNHQFHDYQ
ncbi:agamous-like MADS-box protein AGL82 [Eucalyptus grandis]|uniref:agamous-like MADS-box protein AGL82 n=1 Tax=Eucalyptus grandis TaxID=71139 RepID=UPI00192EE97B|nr:agamous-like MADS-box protein AGL82 [Eucalyptus grandis]